MTTRGLQNWVFAAGALLGMSPFALAGGVPSKTDSAPASPASGDVVVWDAIPQSERAGLWPMLTHEQRLFQWRYMSKADRQHLKKEMTDDEKRLIKRRYVIDSRLLEAAANRPQRKLTDEEKRLLREQIMEVHIEIRRGVPFDCQDPSDCRTSADRARRAQDAARRSAPPPPPAVP